MSEKPAQGLAFHPPLSFSAFPFSTFPFQRFSFFLSLSPFPRFSVSAFQLFSFSFSPSLSLSRAPTAWPHECPCTGRWNLFHSPQTLALDTDPGVVPNQKQGAKRGLVHINEAYQTSCA
jgi:hypothetical protein